MPSDLYLLNALWFGAALVFIGALLPKLWRVVCFVVVMCLPFGLVAGWQVACNIITALRRIQLDGVAPTNNVTSIDEQRKAK